MEDAVQWVIYLIVADVGLIIVGLFVLMSIVMLYRFARDVWKKAI